MDVLEFAHIGEAVNILVEIDEGAKMVHFVDFPGNRISNGVLFGDSAPRIVLERLHRKRDARVFDADNFRAHGVACPDDGSGIVDKLPGKFGNMHQSFDALFFVAGNREFDEGAKIDNAAHFAGNSVADRE